MTLPTRYVRVRGDFKQTLGSHYLGAQAVRLGIDDSPLHGMQELTLFRFSTTKCAGWLAQRLPDGREGAD